MLLKCKYLAQFSLNELTKNSINIANAEARCPFLSFARNSVQSSMFGTDAHQKNDTKVEEKQQNMPEHDLNITSNISTKFCQKNDQIEGINI
jgi:hypothetical protein